MAVSDIAELDNQTINTLYDSIVSESEAGQVSDDDEDYAWNPADFGEFDIEKIKAIAKIWEKLLKAITLKVDSTLPEFKDVYTKEEVLRLLTDYVLKSDFSNLAGEVVKEKADNYFTGLEQEGKIVTSDSLVDIDKLLGWLVQICFAVDKEKLIRTGPGSFTAFSTQIFNLDTVVNGVSGAGGLVGRTYALEGMLYSDPAQRSKSIIKGDQDAETLSTEAQTIFGAINEIYNLLTSLQSIQDLSSIQSIINGFKMELSTALLATQGWESRFQSLQDSINKFDSSQYVLKSKYDEDIAAIKQRLKNLDGIDDNPDSADNPDGNSEDDTGENNNEGTDG